MTKKNVSIWVLSLVSLFATNDLIANETAGDPKHNWTKTAYSKDIPSVHSVLGYKIGDRISSHDQMIKYFEALASAAPERIKLTEYATTWEGRKLIYAAISSKSNIANLESFAQNMQQLSNPQSISKKQANSLLKQTPSSVWLGYSVHGNEISGTDSAMRTAYHLLAANDASINQILNDTIVFIDPLQNPDGRTRFTSRYYATVGLEHSADRQSAEHNEPWPNGRSNHYLFDMNRDWLAATQPETKGRIKALNKFRPLVVIDLHEMGGDQSYYFAPAAKPINPDMTQEQIDNMGLIGKNIGHHFDQGGYDYFTREIFDAFYPGYGDSWPTFYGASASTFEVSSARGEIFKKRSGEILTYANTVERHFVASLATIEGVSKNREKLINDYYDYQLSAIEEGKSSKGNRFYIFDAEQNRAGAHRLATLMAEHDVKVYRSAEAFKSCKKEYSAGSFIIDSAQPKGRFVKTTFEQQVDMSSDFVTEQERLRARKLSNQIYDVTGWSLPLMFGVQTDTCKRGPKVEQSLVKSSDTLSGTVDNKDATVAFIVPWGDLSAGRFLTHSLRKGLTIKSADKAFTLEGETYPAGSLILERRKNDKDLVLDVLEIAQKTGAIVKGVDTSWVTNGPSFGSNNTPTIVAPKIAMAWDEPVSSLSAGHTRFVIERQFDYPVTAIRSSQLSYADLQDYHVLILPNGYYGRVLGSAGAKNIKEWVRNGGVLVTFAGATKFAAQADIGLLDVKTEAAIKGENKNPYGDSKADDDKLVEGIELKSREDMMVSAQNTKEKPDFVAGVLANVEVDQEHWLTVGVNKNVVALAYGNDIFTPIRLKSGKNLAWFASAEDVLASGYLWEENKTQLAYKPFLIFQPTGRGVVISYTQEPTARAYLDGLNVMLLNSLFRAPAHVYRMH